MKYNLEVLPDEFRKLIVFPSDDSGCWIWKGKPMKKEGYGRVWYKGESYLSHRMTYELFIGKIPAGLDIDHLCRNRICVNPGHLEPVTRRINILRGVGITAIHAAKTHCKHGHPLFGSNVRLEKYPYGFMRRRITCRKATAQRKRKRASIKNARQSN